MKDDRDGHVGGCDPPAAIAPAIAPFAFLPVGTSGQTLGAWAVTRSEEEHLKLRNDRVEDLWADRATLLEPFL